MLTQPPISYLRNDGISLAYQVVGAQSLPPLLVIHGWVSHLALDWEEPRWVRWCERMATFGRLVRFDTRGTGLSDRPPAPATLQERASDALAVLDALRIERAYVLAYSAGGAAALRLAATHPERLLGMALYGTQSCFRPRDDYQWGTSDDVVAEFVRNLDMEWGQLAFAERWAPRGDERFAQRWAAYQRAAASPSAAAATFASHSLLDVRPLLGTLRLPVLVLHRHGDRMVASDAARYMAERIPGARFVEFPGEDHVLWAGDIEPICNEIERFITGTRRPRRWAGPAGLTPRELEVLRLLTQGMTKPEIASALFVSPATVHTHVVHIYEKIGVSSRAGATLFAAEHRLLDART